MRTKLQPSGQSSTVEDYLETILELLQDTGSARVADIAEALHISQASVSNMMRRLDEKELLKYEKYRGVTLTEEGERLAKRISKRHAILAEFLELVGITGEIAHDDIEGMEHHISAQTLRGLEQLVTELRNDSAMRNRVMTAVDDENT